MAILGLFAKRDKSKPPPDQNKTLPDPTKSTKSTTSSTSSSSQLSAPSNIQIANGVYNGPSAASSSKLMLGFRGKKAQLPPGPATDDNGFLRPPDFMSRPPRFSSSRSESGHDYLGPPPSRSDLFAAHGESSSARSTRSLPTTPVPAAHSRTGSRDAISLNNAAMISPILTSPTPPVQKKSKGMFAWAHRERKKSKSVPSEVRPPDVLDDSSFNLKAFRHVRAVSPVPAEIDSLRPPSALSGTSFTPPVRPRGSSVASADSSQRISVAAFREMAARRSAANSPSPSSPEGAPLVRPPSALASTPPQHGRRRVSAPRTPASPMSDSTSDESEEEEDDDDDDKDSAGSSTLRPNRAVGPSGTITPRSAGKGSSELGHRTRPTPPRMAPSTSAQSSGSARESLYSRARASHSTSALMPNAAARRASMLAAAKATTADSAGKLAKKPTAGSDSDTSSSSSDDDSDSDNAPLAKYVPPKRPGSSTSNATSASASRRPQKPLIDISGLTPPPLQASPEEEKAPTPPAKENGVSGNVWEREKEKEKVVKEPLREIINKEPERDREKEKAASSPVDKPSLNDRLARLAQSVAAARSTNNLSTQDFPQKEDGHGLSPLRQPKRSQTAPVEQFAAPFLSASASPVSPASPVSVSVSPTASGVTGGTAPPPSPTRNRANGRSMSTPNAMEGIKDLSDPTPIVPTPIRERSPPPAFSVTSRPASQLGLTSHTHLAGTQQPTVRVVGSARSPPPVSGDPSETRAGLASKSPLVSDTGRTSSQGFTGGGLLASPAGNSQTDAARSSPAPRASPAPSSTHTSSPALRAARHRSATMDQSPAGLSPRPVQLKDETAAPVPVRPFALRNTGSGGRGDASSRVSSSSVSTLSNTSSPRSQSASNLGMQSRVRAGTVGAPGGASVGAPPVKPFASTGFRGNSPASSTGESSSGRTPVTPGDGSEVSYAPRDRQLQKEREKERERQRQNGNAAAGGTAAAARRAHRKSASVTFDESERGRVGREREKEERAVADAGAEESRRKERRRSEAKAALELGRIVNGHGPVVKDDEDDDEDRPLDNMPPRMSMMSSMMGVPVPQMGSMGMNMAQASPMGWQSPQAGMMNPQQLMFPMVPPTADSAFLAAHQQAMMVAKQAYQMAVAQQAMAAAEEEWERGSTAATSMLGSGGRSGFGGNPMTPMFPSPTGFGMGMGGMGGMGMPMQPGWGGMMFPSSAQSMYAGSVAGSELGANGRGAGWGSRSAYGDPSGNDRASVFRNSQYGFPPPMPPRAESFGQVGQQMRPGPRPRTRTAPTAAPPSDASRRPPPPPSSWKTGARPA